MLAKWQALTPVGDCPSKIRAKVVEKTPDVISGFYIGTTSHLYVGMHLHSIPAN